MNDLFKQEDLPVIDETKNYLTELVGDDKKFKTPEALARGKYEADITVDLYKKRMDELRVDYLKLREESTKQAKLEELMDQMQRQRLADSEQTQAREDGPKPLKQEEVEDLFQRKYQEQRTRERQDDNQKLVLDELQKKWGDNYSRLLKQKTEELDLSEDEVRNMAKNNPKLLFRTIGIDQQPQGDVFNAPPRSQQRSDSFAPSAPKQRTWSYYQELKKANPQLYLDRKTAIQMAKDAVSLGEAFQDGNYFVKGLHEHN